MRHFTLKFGSATIALALGACAPMATETVPMSTPDAPPAPAASTTKFLSPPLVTEIYTADPSAHVWNDGRIYIYPSRDIESGVAEDDLGSHFDMRDYQVLSMDRIGGPVTVHPTALDKTQVPWVGRQMWAPDAAYKNGTYYLYFPAKDKQDVFRIGVATSASPVGPFTPQAEPIPGSYSIDPNVFKDTDGEHYMIFGGIWGGQLQNWQNGDWDKSLGVTDLKDDAAPAIRPRIARMSDDMLTFAEPARQISIVDEAGKELTGGDHDRRFFEGAWMVKKDGVYYLTYSTGDTHYLVYATGTSPYGPFTYRGRILEPVQGWTSHHSIVQIDGQWYLFYHDTELSGKTHLRNVKVTPLTFNADGSIQTIKPMSD